MAKSLALLCNMKFLLVIVGLATASAITVPDNDQMLQLSFGPGHTCAATATAGKCFMKPSCLDGNNQPVAGSETWEGCQCADNAATNKFEGNLILDAAGNQRFTTRETCLANDATNMWKTAGCAVHPFIKYLCPTSCPPETFGDKCVDTNGSVVVQPRCNAGALLSAAEHEADCTAKAATNTWGTPNAYVAADYTKDNDALVMAMFGATCSQGATLGFCAQAPAHSFLCPESCALLTNQNAVIAELQPGASCEDAGFDCSENELAEYFCGKTCQQPIRYWEFVVDNDAMLEAGGMGDTCAEEMDYEKCTTSLAAKAICPVTCLTKPAEHLCCGAADKDTTTDKVSQACYAVLLEARFFGISPNPPSPCASAKDGDKTTKECKVELYKKFSCPAVPFEGGPCNEQSWPDLDHDLVCGECKVLVDQFDSKYGTCTAYCAAVGEGLDCVGAWEESDDDCEVLHDMTCDEELDSSDALCECAEAAEVITPSECGRNSVTKDATCTCTNADLPCKVKHADSDFHDCYNVGAGGLPDGTSPVTPDDPKCVAKKAEVITAAASKLSATALATMLSVAVLATV